jgi:3-oxoacyl-[acyl-carrier protein] reductase
MPSDTRDGSCNDVPRVALVSGASGLIGRAVCAALARPGMTIAGIFHTRRDEALATGASVEARGGRFLPVQANLMEGPAPRRACMAEIERSVGTPDILVACAGAKPRGPLLSQSAEGLDSLVSLNVVATIDLARLALRALVRRGWGRVILVGSRAGTVGMPGQAAYAATKAALSAWASSAAFEVGRRGVTVNVVAPGAIEDASDTTYSQAEAARVQDLIGCGRLGSAAEVGAVVAFLASPAASYVNGATIAVDGGARF